MHKKHLRTALFALAVLTLAGCAETGKAPPLVLQAVDAQTHTPIHGVQITRHSYSNNILGGSREQDAVYGQTNDNGIIVASDLTHGRIHELFMRHPGYANGGFSYVPDDRLIIIFLPGDKRQRYWPLQKVNIIPMFKASSDTTRPVEVQK